MWSQTQDREGAAAPPRPRMMQGPLRCAWVAGHALAALAFALPSTARGHTEGVGPAPIAREELPARACSLRAAAGRGAPSRSSARRSDMQMRAHAGRGPMLAPAARCCGSLRVTDEPA